jgi:hypothetical protein
VDIAFHGSQHAEMTLHAFDTSSCLLLERALKSIFGGEGGSVAGEGLEMVIFGKVVS